MEAAATVMDPRTAILSKAQIWVGPQVVWSAPQPGQYLIALPGGEDLSLTVTPDPVPPTPTPTPPPLVDLMPMPPAGVTVERLPASSTKTFIPKSNTWYAPAPSVRGDRATINADTGLMLLNGTTNAAVFGVDLVGNGNKGYGIDARGKTGLSGIRFENGSCRNFINGASIHAPTIEGPNVHKGITIRNWRMMDTMGPGESEGQGAYIANVDGLEVEECMSSNIGLAPMTGKTHGWYIAAGCRNVHFNRCIGFKIEAGFIQTRGGEVKFSDPDSGDTPVIENCVSYDAAVGFYVNGRRTKVLNNFILQGHHTDSPNTLGGCAVWASVGNLTSDGNLLISSPVKGAGYTEQWHNGGRSDVAWGYRGPCKTTGTNVTRTDVVVDLSDLEKRGRSGEPIGPLVDEAQQRCRKAVG